MYKGFTPPLFCRSFALETRHRGIGAHENLTTVILNGLLKFTLVAAIIGTAMWAIQRAQQEVNSFAVKVKKLGIPRLSGSVVTLPLDVEFNNTTGLTINIPDFVADLYILDNQNQWKKGGFITQNITLQPGKSEKRIEPKVDLRQIFGGKLLDTLDTIFTSITNRSITIKADARGTANGVPIQSISLIPQQTIAL